MVWKLGPIWIVCILLATSGFGTSQKTPEQYQVNQLKSLLGAYSQDNAGNLPETWEQLRKWVGDAYWESSHEFELITRRFALIGVTGSISDSRENGPINGLLILAPLHPIQQLRSTEEGRFTIWKANDGSVFERWLTEKEFKTFTGWPDVERKLAAAKSAIAKMPTRDVQSMPPMATASVPASSHQVPNLTVRASPSLTTAVTPPSRAERRPLIWPWIIGVAAIVVIAAAVLKRRA